MAARGPIGFVPIVIHFFPTIFIGRKACWCANPRLQQRVPTQTGAPTVLRRGLLSPARLTIPLLQM